MGAIRGVIENLDNSNELGKAQRELVENLAKLAESKAEFFELQISSGLRTAGSPDNQTVPVESVLNSETYTHAIASNTPEQIGKAVKSALNSFCSGGKEEILNGVSDLITNTLTTFLGASSASTGTKKQYYVLTEGWSVVRVDLMAWYLNVEAEGIKKQIQKTSAFVVVKSAVDLSQVRFNTFLNIYQSQLATMKLKDNQIETALDEAKKIYEKFHSVTNNSMPAATSSPIARIAAIPGAK